MGRDGQKKALALMSWNDLEIKNKGKFQYEVVKMNVPRRVLTGPRRYSKWTQTNPPGCPWSMSRFQILAAATKLSRLKLERFVSAEKWKEIMLTEGRARLTSDANELTKLNINQ